MSFTAEEEITARMSREKEPEMAQGKYLMQQNPKINAKKKRRFSQNPAEKQTLTILGIWHFSKKIFLGHCVQVFRVHLERNFTVEDLCQI